MRLLLTVPTGVAVDAEATKVIAESTAGSFCLLPRHADVVHVLEPGLLSWWGADGCEVLAAVDHGVLVKVGEVVRVACERAVVADDPSQAAATVRDRFEAQSEREARARTALLRLEADILRRMGEMRSGA